MISMEFSADGTECTVTTAFTNSNLGMNKVNYFVYVNEQNQSFFMNEGPVWSSKLDYSGYLSDGKIIISIWPERDGSSIELKKTK